MLKLVYRKRYQNHDENGQDGRAQGGLPQGGGRTHGSPIEKKGKKVQGWREKEKKYLEGGDRGKDWFSRASKVPDAKGVTEGGEWGGTVNLIGLGGISSREPGNSPNIVEDGFPNRVGGAWKGLTTRGRLGGYGRICAPGLPT